MKLTEAQRELIERSLDEMYDAIMDNEEIDGQRLLKLTRLYVSAVAVVRDVPDGDRRIRGDFGTVRRPRPQAELAV